MRARARVCGFESLCLVYVRMCVEVLYVCALRCVCVCSKCWDVGVFVFVLVVRACLFCLRLCKAYIVCCTIHIIPADFV